MAYNKKLLDLETGVPKLWELIKSKIGDYLPLAGGTMKTNSSIYMPGASPSITVGTMSDSTEGVVGQDVVITDESISFKDGAYDTSLGDTLTYIGRQTVTTGQVTSEKATFSNGMTTGTLEATGAATFSGDVTVSGTVNAEAISTDSIMDISGENGVVISSVNGGVTVSSDSGDIILSAGGEVQTSDLSVSGSVQATSTVTGTNFNYSGTITDTVAKAWGASLFDFTSGSLVSAKVIGLDTVNKIATVMYGLKCPNPATPLTITDEYDDTVVGRVWGGSNNGYVGGFVIAVPYNGTSLDINTTYEVS